MKLQSRAVETRSETRAAKLQGKRVGFVPTMGALHDGHISLVRAAKAQSDFVLASIFVNPTQFGPNEDLAKYPRTFEADRKKLEAEGVDLLFAPSVEEMYPDGAVTFVPVEGISDRLDGRSRPGHFRGVATVVAKIVVVPIVREPDGLALSSRNAYLSPAERKQATVLSRALREVHAQYRSGERSAARLIEAARQVFASEPSVRLDYVEIVDRDTLESVSQVKAGTLVAVAAFVGSTRLIDNVVLT